MKTKHLRLAAATVALLGAASAQAFTCSIHVSNQSLAAAGFSCTLTGSTITIVQTFATSQIGTIAIGDLGSTGDFTVNMTTLNSSGDIWSRMAVELLDPSGQNNDSLDTVPQPAFVPVGFSTSNDNDGLSFAQGSGLPRTSTIFSSVLADELSDVRDFLDYFGGTQVNGSTDTLMTFGLRDSGANQPFLLALRPNESSRNTVSEPGSLMLVGLALAAVGALRRRRA
jgi:hypothetical protein